MPKSTRPRIQAADRAHQLRDAKRRQRARQRAAGMIHVQLTVPRSTAEKLAVARQAGRLERALEEVLDRSVIRIADYPQLAEIAWNRSGEFISADEAFRLYERNWRFLRGADLQPRERELIDRLAQEFGGGLINA